MSCLWNEFYSYHHLIAKPILHNLFCCEIITCQGTNFSMSPSRLSAFTLQKLQWFKVYFMLMSQSSMCCQEKCSCPHTQSFRTLVFIWVSSHFFITSESPVDSLNLANKREKRMSCVADKVFGVWALKECFSLYCIPLELIYPGSLIAGKSWGLWAGCVTRKRRIWYYVALPIQHTPVPLRSAPYCV